MKNSKTIRTILSRSTLILVALLFVALGGSVLAHGDENEDANTDRTTEDSISHDKKQEALREHAKRHLEGDKLKACERREKVINSILDRVANRGERRLEVYNSIFERVQEFYEKKGLSVGNYSELIADTNAKKAAAQAAIDKTSSDEVDFHCDGDDPKGAAEGFKAELKAEIKTLHEYRKSIRNLIVAIKTALSEPAQSEPSGGEGEQ